MSIDVMVLDSELQEYNQMGRLAYEAKYGVEALTALRLRKAPFRWCHFWTWLGDWVCERLEYRYKIAYASGESVEGLPDGYWAGYIILKPSDCRYLYDLALETLREYWRKQSDRDLVPNYAPPNDREIRQHDNLQRFVISLLDARLHDLDIEFGGS